MADQNEKPEGDGLRRLIGVLKTRHGLNIPDRVTDIPGLIIAVKAGKRVSAGKAALPGKAAPAGDAREFAAWCADTLNGLRAAGQDEGEQADDLLAALDGTGWTVIPGEGGRWRVTAEGPQRMSLTAGAKRAPKGRPVTISGKEYRPGQFIPAGEIADASPQEKKALEEAIRGAVDAGAGRHEKRLERDADPGKLRQRIASYARRHQLSGDEQRRAAASARMLHRHHGPATLHRLEELAGSLETALANVDDDAPNAEGLRGQLEKRLAGLGVAIDHATKAGVSGRGKGAVAPKTPPAPKAPAKPAVRPTQAPAKTPAPPAPAKPAPAKPAPDAPRFAFPAGGQLPPKNAAADRGLRAAFSALKAAPSETKALHAYTTDDVFKPDSYTTINAHLRGTLRDEEVNDFAAQSGMKPDEYRDRMRGAITELDRFLSRATLPEPVLVTRGLRLGPAAGKEFLARVERCAASGEPVQLKGYQSTTVDPSVAAESFGGGSTGVLLEIAAARGAYVAGISDAPEEAELLLPRDCNYRVAGFREVKARGKTVRVIQLEQLP